MWSEDVRARVGVHVWVSVRESVADRGGHLVLFRTAQ